MLPRHGIRAEVFVAGMGAVLAFSIGALAGDIQAFGTVERYGRAAVLVLAGFTLLFGLRGGAVLADVAFAAAFWLFGAAFVVYGLPGWSVLSASIALVIAVIGVLRITRFAIAVPAASLMFAYITGGLPSIGAFMVLIGAPIALVAAAILLYVLRHRIRAWSNRTWHGRISGD